MHFCWMSPCRPVSHSGNKIDMYYAASEDELRYYLCIQVSQPARVRSTSLIQMFDLLRFSCAVLYAKWNMATVSDECLNSLTREIEE